jgi:hypothetical protein
MVWSLSKLGICGLVGCCLYSNARGEVNSWTKPVSGNWEEPYWSRGAPNTNHTIMFTNAGWKALAIGASTVASAPQSLNVNAIQISSPTNSFNTLLLNYAGQTPLRANSLIVGGNSAVVMLQSALQVNASGTSAFSVNGTFTGDDNSLIEAPYMSIGELGAAVLNLTNSTMKVPVEFFGGAYPGTIHHASGFNLFTSLHLNNADYRLYGGDCVGDIVIGDNLSATFHQFGGSVTGTVALAHGSYFLAGGTYSSPQLIIPAVTYSTLGSFVQSGGANITGPLTVGTYYGGLHGSYDLSGGVLNTTGTHVSFHGGFDQSGGVHAIQGRLDVLGGIILKGGGAVWAFYDLSDGLILSDSVNVVISVFAQSGGTNQTGELTVGPHYAQSSYLLSGGRLQTVNTTVYGSWQGAFRQSMEHGSGTHVISNLLSLVGDKFYPATYVLNGGDLIARDIYLSQGGVRHLGGSITHSGVLTLAGGIWEENTTQQQLGPLQLSVSAETNSSIRLPGTAGILRFAASSSLIWSNDALLIIENWNGLLQGGGSEQILFGTSATGLTPPQLSQVRFRDPANCAPGLYPASLLGTGEVVPGPFLDSRPVGNQLVLRWNDGFVLQSATNVSGPYEDLTQANSPYTNSLTEARRFFRLRR